MRDHYSFIAANCSNLLFYNNEPNAALEELLQVYILKGVGVPEYDLDGNFQCVKYLDPNVNFIQDQWTSDLSEKTYIGSLTEHVARLLGLENVDKMHHYNSPMESEYHPETDDIPLLAGENIYNYRILIGSVMWSVDLVRYYAMYAVVTLARYNMSHHAGYYKSSLRIVRYCHCYNKESMGFDTRELDVGDV